MEILKQSRLNLGQSFALFKPRASLSMTTSAQLIEHGELGVLPSYSFDPYVVVSLILESILQPIENKMWTPT